MTGETDAGTHKEGDVKNDYTCHNLCGGLLRINVGASGINKTKAGSISTC